MTMELLKVELWGEHWDEKKAAMLVDLMVGYLVWLLGTTMVG